MSRSTVLHIRLLTPEIWSDTALCGICGFAGNGTIDDLKRMNDSLIHRGPDAEGLWSDFSKGIFFGHRRLSIIDISGGAQPMWTRDGSIGITFNGEIYNYKDLRIELEKAGHIFVSDHSDTEILLYGYRQWGEHIVDRLNGMWAFAIYDKQNNLLFLSRDRFGKKPLYYASNAGTFMFSSELTSLQKHSGFDFQLSKRALKKFFAYNYIPAPLTLYESVYKLPAGHNLFYSLSDRTPRLQKYWEFHLEPFEKIPQNAENLWAEELRDLIDKAVQRRLMSDVPLGIFLSGGIDSTSVAYFATKHIPSQKIRTFSIGFDEASFDESAYSSLAAHALTTDHHHRKLSLDIAESTVLQIICNLDEPLGDSSLLPTWLLCNESRKFVTVALGGDGADELFAGYDPFCALNAAQLYSSLVPKPVHEAIRLIMNLLPVSHVNMSADFRIKRTLRGLSYPKKLWNPVWQAALSPGEINNLFSEHTPLEDLYSDAIECWDSCKQKNLIDKTLEYYTKLYLQNDILTKIDRASMMNSLEVRAPYLDIDLVNFVRRIPSSYKYRNGTTKYILKKALQPLIPARILNRKKKGFGVPIGKWFQTGVLNLNDTSGLAYYNDHFVKKQFLTHQNRMRDNRGFLWNLWILKQYCGKAAIL
jgi:asparagine synthase (glutamine-hydrolysing)